ncbi:coatomer protein complex subunit beta 2 [Boletus coccyginus]|nr:coatomer protein complex subunit beta 2 [Boletus coccyginus]
MPRKRKERPCKQSNSGKHSWPLSAENNVVQCVWHQLSPYKPWVLTGLYNGSVNIYNHEMGTLVKTFEVSNIPIHCVKFIPRQNWFIADLDDFQLCIFNYNTHEKVVSFEAHPDYIRCLVVHLMASIMLMGSNDMMIKAWNWDKQ